MDQISENISTQEDMDLLVGQTNIAGNAIIEEEVFQNQPTDLCSELVDLDNYMWITSSRI